MPTITHGKLTKITFNRSKEKFLVGTCHRYTDYKTLEDKLFFWSYLQTNKDYWIPKSLRRHYIGENCRKFTGPFISGKIRQKMSRTQRLLERNYINQLKEGYLYKVYVKDGEFIFRQVGRI